MPTDPHRALVQKRELAIAIEALMREEVVVNLYASRGKRVIASDDNQTRIVLRMAAAEPADVLVGMGPRQLVIAEVKGSNLDRALTKSERRHESSRALHKHCMQGVRSKPYATRRRSGPPWRRIWLTRGADIPQ